ncbi:hypothetical protein [Aeriscardovia aeriphila]|uniref:Uncharacterized protein n=1 Tax=Aeriscardovia aeriphila TaxID=218139 RepID=A0A261FAU4_9BIFI|nr:hypothetical protein [Aeriscardovia aeriphila]NYI25590.1 hypothetical protein [Aeriscardovia aeriphila]OZG56261.1 hypothetical protein AEAE_0749 [Aeriscardovia aeriphila]
MQVDSAVQGALFGPEVRLAKASQPGHRLSARVSPPTASISSRASRAVADRADQPALLPLEDVHARDDSAEFSDAAVFDDDRFASEQDKLQGTLFAASGSSVADSVKGSAVRHARWVLTSEVLVAAARGQFDFDFRVAFLFWSRLAQLIRLSHVALPRFVAVDLATHDSPLGQWVRSLQLYWSSEFSAQDFQHGIFIPPTDFTSADPSTTPRAIVLERPHDNEVTLATFMHEAGGF